MASNILRANRSPRRCLGPILIAACFLLAAGVRGQSIPDLTQSQTLGVNESKFFYLGPTGMKGWMYWSSLTTEARQILVTEVRAGTPADGVMEYHDVILGINGNLFTNDARTAFVDAVNDAEATGNSGELYLTVFRPSLTTTNTYMIQLEEMGTLSATTPYDCPKVDRMVTNFCEYVYNNGPVGGSTPYPSLWAMLASGVPKYVDWAEAYIKAQDWATKTDRSVYRDTELKVWYTGYQLVTMAQLYLLTSDATLLPAIEDIANFIAQGQDWKGLWGHTMAWPQNNGGELHGTLPGYGALNQSGLVGLYGLALAQRCGVSDPEVDEAVTKAAEYFRAHMYIGAINYGYHSPAVGVVDSNGRMGIAAHVFRALDDPEAAKWFTMMTSIYKLRDWGHTGNEFNHCWGPMAADVGGPWLANFVQSSRHVGMPFYLVSLTMRRMPEGTFQSQGQEGRGNGRQAGGTGGGHATGGYGVQLAANRSHIELTGAGYDTNLYALTEVEIEQVEFGLVYESNSSDISVESTAVLVSNLWHYAPKITAKAADALNTRIAGDANLESNLVAIVEDELEVANARVAALRALGDTYRGQVKDTVDTWYHPDNGYILNWGAASYGPKDVTTWTNILYAITQFDVSKGFTTLLVKEYARSIYSMDFDLLDEAGQELYYDAVEIMLRPGAGHGWFVGGQNIKNWDPLILARYADSLLRVAEMFATDYDANTILKNNQIGEGMHSAMVRSTDYTAHRPDINLNTMDTYGQNWGSYSNYTHALKTHSVRFGGEEDARYVTDFLIKESVPPVLWFRDLIATNINNTLTNQATKLADLRYNMTVGEDDDLFHAVTLDEIVSHPDNTDPFVDILDQVGFITPVIGSNWRLYMGAVELGIADTNTVTRWMNALAVADAADNHRQIGGILHVLAGKEAPAALAVATNYLYHANDSVAIAALDVIAEVGTTSELLAVFNNYLTNSVLPEVDGEPVFKNDYWMYANWDAITSIVDRDYAGALALADQMAVDFNSFTSNGTDVDNIAYRSAARTPPFSILNPTLSQREVLGFGNGIYGVLGLFSRDNDNCRDALISVHTNHNDPYYNRGHDFTSCEAQLAQFTVPEIVALENSGGSSRWNERAAMYYLIDRLIMEEIPVANQQEALEVRNGRFQDGTGGDYYYGDAYQIQMNLRRGVEETDGVHFFYLK